MTSAGEAGGVDGETELAVHVLEGRRRLLGTVYYGLQAGVDRCGGVQR